MKIKFNLYIISIIILTIIDQVSNTLSTEYSENEIYLENNKLSKINSVYDTEKIRRTYRFEDDRYHVTHSNYTIYPTSDYNKGFEFATGECDYNKNCFLPFGVCVNETTCMCMPDYANVKLNKDSFVENNLSCSYKKKKVVVAATLELFLPLGLGHLYAEKYKFAIIKITYNFVVYGYGYVLYYKGLTDNSKISSIAFCIILTCLIPLWNLVDVALFFTYTYKDGNGIPMS
jgi:hypothetical protein